MKLLGATIAAGLFLIGMASAGPFEDGWKAYEAGNFDEAVRLLEPLAR